MRKAQINVNPIVAYNYKFLLKITIDTFTKFNHKKYFHLLIVQTANTHGPFARELGFESYEKKKKKR